MKTRKKLIEIALSLAAINMASAQEKSIGCSPRPSLPDRPTWAPATRWLLEEL